MAKRPNAEESAQDDTGTDKTPAKLPFGAGLVAAVKTAIFKLAKGTEVPEKFDGAEVNVTLAGDTDDPTQAMVNMLALAGGSAQAVIDAFNGQGVALTKQKAVKKLANTDGVVPTDDEDKPTGEAPVITLADLQKVSDETLVKAVERGKGEQKKAEREAKAAKADAIGEATTDVLADLRATRETDRDAAEAQLALMKRLKVVAASVTLDEI